jgi:C4-dicarboxylate transporter
VFEQLVTQSIDCTVVNALTLAIAVTSTTGGGIRYFAGLFPTFVGGLSPGS